MFDQSCGHLACTWPEFLLAYTAWAALVTLAATTIWFASHPRKPKHTKEG